MSEKLFCQTVKIAIDAMGGDHGPVVTVAGCARALRLNPNLFFILYGQQDVIEAELKKYPALQKAVQVQHTDKMVLAHEKPSQAIRSGRDSSMGLAIKAVAEKQADAVVSGGNTGALMAIAKLGLRCIEGIDRPAIASVFPALTGSTVMLDLGANLECEPELLIQFATMGGIYARVVRGVENPSIGILNIGSEDVKGHEELRVTHAIMQRLELPGRYYGFIEGNDITKGTVDVVVTDGFTGNVALKTAEGVGKLTTSLLKDALKSSPIAMLGALLAMGALKKLKNQIDPRLYNGGMFLGLNGICVKSHGSMDEVGFANAILVAADLVANNFNARVAGEIQNIMPQVKNTMDNLQSEKNSEAKAS